MANICGAKTKKDGSPCQRAPVPGRKRCNLHGGHQKRGVFHHRFKTGEYSAYAKESLSDVIEKLEQKDTEELIEPRNQIILLEALLSKCEGIKESVDNIHDLETVSKIIGRLIRAKQDSQSILLEQKTLIPAQDIKVFLQFVGTTLNEYVDSDKAGRILEQIQTFKITDHAD
jgi:hypothetical protein